MVSLAQYEAAVDKLVAGTHDLANELQQVAPAAEAATNHWYVNPFLAAKIIELANKMVELGTKILEKIAELLKGAVAPIYMTTNSMDWMEIKGLATGVAGRLKPEGLTVDFHWKGAGSDAYVKQIRPQADAAARIGTMADKTAMSLIVCAGAALAFYLALGVIVVKFIAALVAAIAAFGTAVLSWAGAALIVEEAGVNTALILSAVGALLAVLGAQAKEMVTLRGEANDGTAFTGPGGTWPNAATANFSDATVKDGDADWSVEG
ncbi:hypothetical protein WEI85_43170 [Actinomycetes bacterium KLBMP 9797]